MPPNSAVDTPLKKLIQGRSLSSMPYPTEPVQHMTFQAEHGIDPVDVGIDMALGGGISKAGRAGAGMAMRGGRAMMSGMEDMLAKRAAMRGAGGELPNLAMGGAEDAVERGLVNPTFEPPRSIPGAVDPAPLPNLPPSPSPDFGKVYGEVPLDTKRAVDAAFDANPGRLQRVMESTGGMDKHVGDIHGSLTRESLPGSPVGDILEDTLASNPEMRSQFNSPDSLKSLVKWAEKQAEERAKGMVENLPANPLVQSPVGAAGGATLPGFAGKKAATPTLRDILGSTMVHQSASRR